MDIVLRLSRPDGAHKPNVRRLDGLSRFDETPDELMIELGEDGTYRALGNEADLAFADAQAHVIDVLQGEADGLTYEALKPEEIPMTTIKRAVKRLDAEGSVTHGRAHAWGLPRRAPVSNGPAQATAR